MEIMQVATLNFDNQGVEKMTYKPVFGKRTYQTNVRELYSVDEQGLQKANNKK